MLIPASDASAWREKLLSFAGLDPTFQPEYHSAYSLRIKGSAPYLWHYEEPGKIFIYPFLLTPIEGSDYFDISSIYGYTGPVANSDDAGFLARAWKNFDDYTADSGIIAEFVRFSPYNKNEIFAHPGAKVEENRLLAVSHLPGNENELLQKLGSKTRNMLRKAENAGLSARELPLPQYLPLFRGLYDETMSRNKAVDFFHYDDAYYNKLLALGSNLRLFGVFLGDRLVAAAMSVVYGKCALYHLGASLTDYARLGAGNLSLYEMSRQLMASGVEFINMTGGRTIAEDDPLLLFKKSNATGTASFYIGKRVINRIVYDKLKDEWKKAGKSIDDNKIIFWRH